jgi:hypothetical protein
MAAPPPLSPRTVRAIVDSGDPVQHARLAGQPGFCLTPMAWPDAAAAVADGSVQALGRMGRDADGVRVYWKWKDEVCGWDECVSGRWNDVVITVAHLG